ncbi:MAG: hypothetical protein VX874_15880 [Pseudomonadota bacterium]|nr:hypothetical protein [Pseudomonadota bacterium]
MTKTHRMKALMGLPAAGKRPKVKRDETFEASDQERLDLLQSGRAVDDAPDTKSKDSAKS